MKNLLLLGDSIRLGYDSFVQEKLAGRMNVYFAEDNGRFAQYTLRELSIWKSKLSWPDDIDVVHWNNGLWDILHLSSKATGYDGEDTGETIVSANRPADLRFDKDPLTPPDMYRYMLGRIVTRIHQLFPRAAVIFATTTPVIEELATTAYRSNAEVELYNRIAREVLIPRGVRINELGDFSKANCSKLHRDWVHYTDEGSELLASEIVSFLERSNLI